eukprot:TRINITY_DN57273_c0_g1_i1.p1 TRINITY_DN57273_c0_g1~~TRINITY_DN57273_c0_g1_i1.p1  ORF type:complete len:1174 (-),score=114.14 TRINITY_DN57273_c0_g1_i1:162-3683(-)
MTMMFVFLFFGVARATTQLHIGAALPLTGQIAIPGRGFFRAYDIAIEHLNEDLPSNALFRFANLSVCDTETSVSKGSDCALEFADYCGTNGYRPVGVLGAGFSSVSLQMVPITTRFKVLQCSPLSSTTDLSSAYNYPFFMRTAPPDDKRAVAILRTVQSFGWDRAVMIYTADRYGTTNAVQIQQSAVSYGISPAAITVLKLDPNFHTLTGEDWNRVEEKCLRTLRLSETRVVIVLALLEDSEALFRIAANGDVLGAGWAWVGADAWANLASVGKLPTVDDGSIGFTHSHLRGSILVIAQEDVTPSTTRFLASYAAKFGTTQTEPFIFAAYDCVQAIGRAVLELLALNTSIVPGMLSNMALDSGLQEQLAAKAMSLEFEGAGGFVQFAKPGKTNAGDRIPRYSVSVWEDKVGWVKRASFDENRNPDFIASGPIIFSNGLENLSAASPGCPAGEELSSDGTSCALCQPGHYKASQGRGSCIPCLPGFACPAGSITMQPCAAGTYSLAAFAKCEQCDVGKMASATVSSSCQECPVGFSQSSKGQTSCEPCPVGKFQNSSGKASCHECPRSLTTAVPGEAREANCRCAVGKRPVQSQSNPTSCVNCGVGLNCSQFGEEPLLLPGYFMYDSSPRNEPKLNLFKCQNSYACVGQQKQQENICSQNRYGLNCGQCIPGYRASGGASPCEPCSSFDPWLVPVSMIATYFLIGLLHYMYNHGKEEHVDAAESILASMTLGTTVAFVQNLGIIGKLSIAWPGFLDTMFSVFSPFLFDFSLFSPGCLYTLSFASTYAMRVLPPMLFFLLVSVWWVVSRCVSLIWKRFPVFNAAELANTAGLVVFSLYVSVAKGTFTFLDCYESPNGKRVLREIPYALCFEGEYFSVLPLFVVAVLINVCAISSLIVYAIFGAPTLYPRRWFRTSSRFLLFKYRPNRWWYQTFAILRSIGLALTTVVFPDGVFEQWAFSLVIYLCSLVVHLVWRPYTEAYANHLECIEMACLCMVMVFGAAFLDIQGQVYENTVVSLIVTTLSICFFCVIVAGSYAMLLAVRPQTGKALREREARLVQDELTLACKTIIGLSEGKTNSLVYKSCFADVEALRGASAYINFVCSNMKPRKLLDVRLGDGVQRLACDEELPNTSLQSDECTKEELAMRTSFHLDCMDEETFNEAPPIRTFSRPGKEA